MRKVSNIDWSILLVALVLTGLGLVMIYSSSAIEAYELVGQTPYFFHRQLIWAIIALGICIGITFLPLEVIEKLTPLFYVMVIILLLVVLVPFIGVMTRGSRRWLDLGIFGFQPAELAKLSVILAGTLYLTRIEQREKTAFRDLLFVCILGGIPALLVLIQPDLSSSIQIFSVSLILLFISGFAYRHLFSLLVLLMPVLGVAIFISGYRRARIVAFINPWSDPLAGGYQSIHLMRSLASGGVLGRGLGTGVHRYLPEPFTDSIVAVLGEELGLIGIGILLSLLVFLVYRGITVSLQTGSPYTRLLGVSMTSLIALQAIMNLAVVIGFLPTTGVPMPFISYGGTSLVVNMIIVGTILNISGNR